MRAGLRWRLGLRWIHSRLESGTHESKRAAVPVGELSSSPCDVRVRLALSQTLCTWLAVHVAHVFRHPSTRVPVRGCCVALVTPRVLVSWDGPGGATKEGLCLRIG